MKEAGIVPFSEEDPFVKSRRYINALSDLERAIFEEKQKLAGVTMLLSPETSTKERIKEVVAEAVRLCDADVRERIAEILGEPE